MKRFIAGLILVAVFGLTAAEDFSVFFAGRASVGQLSGADQVVTLRGGVTKRGFQTNLTWINVATFGVLPGNSGSANDTAMNAAIPGLTRNCVLYFPAGVYQTAAGWDFTAVDQITLRGDMRAIGSGTSGTVITGNFAGSLITTRGNTWSLMDIQFQNIHASGVCVFGNNIAGCPQYIRCAFSGGMATYLDRGNVTNIGLKDWSFSANIAGCSFSSCGIGLMEQSGGGACALSSCDFSGCGRGLRAYGSGISTTGLRIEVCRIGLELGVTFTGASSALSACTFNTTSTEACDIAVYCVNVGNGEFNGIQVSGSQGAPSGQTQYGLYILGCQNLSFNGGTIGGGSSGAAIYKAPGSSIVTLAFNEIIASNGIPGGGRVWDIPAYDTNVRYKQCNNKVNVADTLTNAEPRPNGLFLSMARYNALSSNVTGKNFTILNLPIANNTSSLSVTFNPGCSSGSCDIQTAVATTSGTLSPSHTYYYRATIRTESGEVSSLSEFPVTLNGGQNAATITTFGHGGATNYKMCIYRSDGTIDLFGNHMYQGVYEGPLNGGSTFTDVGATFTDLRSPPLDGTNWTNQQEPDSNYEVWVVTKGWASTYQVTSQTTTGFNIAFTMATPGTGTQKVSCVVLR